MLDPLADKLLTTASFVVMAFAARRDQAAPCLARRGGHFTRLVYPYRLADRQSNYRLYGVSKPTALGRINTFLELGLIIFFLLFHTTGVLLFLLPFCYALVLASVVASGAGYIIQGAQNTEGPQTEGPQTEVSQRKSQKDWRVELGHKIRGADYNRSRHYWGGGL